jgi:tetratricopeptide (TPR) repeat protein
LFSIELFWQVLEFDPLGRRTLLLAAFVVAAAIAIGLLFRHLVRRRRGLSAAPIGTEFGQDEASLLEADWARHKPNSAIAKFDQALALTPHSVEALKGRGICYLEMGQYDLAMQDFHTWVLRAPESGDAFFYRATAWRKLGLIGLAISDYQNAVRLSPSNQAARDALIELMRDTIAGRPRSVLSLSALFAAEVRVDGLLPVNPEPAADAGKPSAG